MRDLCISGAVVGVNLHLGYARTASLKPAVQQLPSYTPKPSTQFEPPTLLWLVKRECSHRDRKAIATFLRASSLLFEKSPFD